jgi:hypothetical protein
MDENTLFIETVPAKLPYVEVWEDIAGLVKVVEEITK